MSANLSATQARWLERSIILLCVASIGMIFQPFSMQLFSIGCVTVVIGALLFNLVPFCEEGVPKRQIGKVIIIILVVLVIAALLGIGTAYVYVSSLGK